jgi:hypothetical protein
VPCIVVHGTGLASACMHGNAGLGLGTLGGLVASEWHDHCVAQGGSEVAASRGIDRARVDELDGEVTGLEVVGGVLPKHDVHGGQWQRPGRRGVAGSVSVGGVELGGQQGGARPLGVYGGGGDRRTEGEGGVLAGWPRVTPFSLMPSR